MEKEYVEKLESMSDEQVEKVLAFIDKILRAEALRMTKTGEIRHGVGFDEITFSENQYNP